jgi:hypothetical protein
MNQYKTFCEWNQAGYFVRRGEKSVARDLENVALFHNGQVCPRGYDKKTPQNSPKINHINHPLRSSRQERLSRTKVIFEPLKGQFYLVQKFLRCCETCVFSDRDADRELWCRMGNVVVSPIGKCDLYQKGGV